MSRERLNLVLMVLLVVTVIANWAIRRDPSKPNYVIMPDMAFSIPYDSFSENPNFPDGKTLQSPIPGTVARGQELLSYAPTPEDAVRAGEELKNPFSSEDAEALRKGGEVYRIYCLPCHGATGKGDGPVAMRGFPPPPPLEGEKTLSKKDGQIFHLITYGQGNMPGYASQIPAQDRWKAVLHVRALQDKALAAAAKLAEEAKARQQASAENAKTAPPAEPETASAHSQESVSSPEPEVAVQSEPAVAAETTEASAAETAVSEQAPPPNGETVQPATAETPEQPKGEHPQ